MTAATAPPPEVEEYLAAVRTALADLPPAERDDLVAEVEASLVEAADEGGSTTARLGPPDEFAAELRAAAGLHAPQPATRTTALARVTAAAAANPTLIAIRGVARELAPIWWVLRGYLVVAIATFAIDATWSTRVPFVPNGFGTAVTGALLILVVAAVSVAIGLAMRRASARTALVASVVGAAIVVAAIPALGEALDESARQPSAASPPPTVPVGLTYDGVPIDNVYPYSRDGKLLHDVLLYDGAGRPLEIASSRADDPNRRFVVTNGNRALFNVFPIRYYEPGTRRVARPNAAPYIELPLVRTPPLPAARGASR